MYDCEFSFDPSLVHRVKAIGNEVEIDFANMSSATYQFSSITDRDRFIDNLHEYCRKQKIDFTLNLG